MANSSNKKLGNIECINGKNFHMWKFQMRAIFMGKELLGIIDESEVEPTTTGIAQIDWKKCDSQTISLLCQALGKKYVEYVVACDITHAIWDKVHVIQEKTPKKMSMHCNNSFSNVIWWKETPLLRTMAKLKWS
jgi:hypothetical protein